MRLIVTDKDAAARKIAEILGRRVTVKEHGRGRDKVNSYHFEYGDGDGEAVAVGLRGHVMEAVLPKSYQRRGLRHLEEMIDDPDLAWVVSGGTATTLLALRSAAKGATEVVIATDYDREGELIGHEALEILRGDALKRHPRDVPDKKKTKPRVGATGRGAAPVPLAASAGDGGLRVKPMVDAAVVDRHVRVRYSALTPVEVRTAFAKPATVDFHLAEAARSRQDIDLVWGTVLTRYMSWASYRSASEHLSVGRVQTPTLRLLVDRELVRRAFVSVPYWEIRAEVGQADEELVVTHAEGRFLAREGMEAALARAAGSAAVVTASKATSRKLRPPVPLATTDLICAASSVGVSPAGALRAADSLYLDGLISYPRTDNTVYPASLDLHRTLDVLASWPPVTASAARLAHQAKLTPTRGKRRTSDHPPVCPVGVPSGELGGDRAKVYELVVSRFLATLLPAAVVESQRLEMTIGEELFVARGSRVASAGFLEVYEKYAAERDRPLPSMEPGDVFAVRRVFAERRETQPPSRYGQATLIEQMEELGLGTKATRTDVVQHLYDCNYVRDDPMEPTELGIAIVTGFDIAMKEAPFDISSGEATAELEAEMDRVSEGAMRREEVVHESQVMLKQAWRLLDSHIDDIRQCLKSDVRQDVRLGGCKRCGGELHVVRGRTGKRFVACMGEEGETPRPSAAGAERPPRGCGQTFPLPQRGTIVSCGTSCVACGWPEIRVVGGGWRGRPWVLCVDIDCPSKEKYREHRTRSS